jgi:NADH:ubiquinone oxidoreductase subunit F (NADH-binding)
VETLMNAPHIIKNGASWFSAIGTARSKGTKVFSISGDVSNPGVYELPMGAGLKELVVDMAGAGDVHAVQIGGAAGNILPRDKMDVTLSHETYLGAGSVVVLDSTRSIIEMVHNNIRFLHEESCGKCTPCRDGLQAMMEIYNRFITGEGQEKDVRVLEDLSEVMALGSLCGLGQAAPVPVLDSLNYFKTEYVNLIKQSAYIRNYAAKVLPDIQ